MTFEKYASEGNEFINRVAQALGTPADAGHASRVSVAILKAIRGRITPEESMHLLSQLPMAIKGMYVDGWKISREPTDSKTMDDFLEEVKMNDPRAPGRDFGNNQETRDTVRAFFGVLKEYVDEGELKDIRAQLPRGIGDLFS